MNAGLVFTFNIFFLSAQKQKALKYDFAKLKILYLVEVSKKYKLHHQKREKEIFYGIFQKLLGGKA